jgi:asparagine synthase (glutamine-hydrolysing)
LEKQLIRNAFCKKHFVNSNREAILPDEILWRKKEAFSDGISSKQNSLFSILQEKINTPILKYSHNSPQTQEQSYYRGIFEEYYPYCSHLLKHFWMPKYVEASDPSARTLDNYE